MILILGLQDELGGSLEKTTLSRRFICNGWLTNGWKWTVIPGKGKWPIDLTWSRYTVVNLLISGSLPHTHIQRKEFQSWWRYLICHGHHFHRYTHDAVEDYKLIVYPYARNDSVKPVVSDERSTDSFTMWQSVTKWTIYNISHHQLTKPNW